MTDFEPRNADYRALVTKSFELQPFMTHIGGLLSRVDPGRVDIELPYRADLAQQYGFVHGGILTSIADSAAGFAAMTLADPGVGVLTSELKVNFLRPAGQGTLLAKGKVIKSGRTLNIVQADVTEAADGNEVHVLTGLVTIMFVAGLK